MKTLGNVLWFVTFGWFFACLPKRRDKIPQDFRDAMRSIDGAQLAVMVDEAEVWQGMKYKEAQKLSVCGTAVWGNEAMRDVIWPVTSPHPFMWVTNGYVPVPDKVGRFEASDEWHPLHPLQDIQREKGNVEV